MKMKNKDQFTYIDLFSGIGGMRIAFDSLGGECVFSSEWDSHCQDMYEHNFGDRPHGDITKIDVNEVPDHDILVGGFPCQAFSICGDRQGFNDTRGTLFFDIERILRAKKPKAFLLENVRNLVTHDNERTFNIIKTKLISLGYQVHYQVLNGLDYGVPQKRERIVIVGFQETYPFRFPDKKPLKITLDDILQSESEIDRKHFLSEKVKNKLQNNLKKTPFYPSIWHENKSGNIGIHPFSCALRAGGSYNYLTVNGERRLTPREMLRLQGFPDSYEIVVSDTQVRKQAGNSVVIPKIRAVAESMLDAMQKQPSKYRNQIVEQLVLFPIGSDQELAVVY